MMMINNFKFVCTVDYTDPQDKIGIYFINIKSIKDSVSFCEIWTFHFFLYNILFGKSNDVWICVSLLNSP